MKNTLQKIFHNLLMVMVLLMFGKAVFAQAPTITSFNPDSWSVKKPEETKQIIIKLKSKILLNKSLYNHEITGNNKVDSITQKFNPIKIKKQTIGKKNKQHIFIITFPIGTNVQQVIDEYYNTGEIEYAEPDYKGSGGGETVTPNDQHYLRQWGLKNNGTFSLSPSIAGADIDMEKAWNIEQGDSNIVVGIIDSGTKLDHPEFTNRIWINYNEIPSNGLDDDSNGYVDDVKGWDFANTDNNPSDDHGHGTNVVGIIGANGNNSIGYAGVDWNCKLMTLKGLDNTNLGYYSWFADAIYYGVDNGANVINMSLGGTGTSTTLQNAVTYALNNNVIIVACMMNTNSNTVYYPAAYTGVIAVGSTNSNDTRSNPFFWSSTSGSNYGSHISVVAPGNYIYGLNYQSNTNYNSYWGGTSQATPLVSGLASLLLAQNPNRTPAQIKSIIERTAKDRVGNLSEDTLGWDQYYGYGRINAFKALSVSPSSLIYSPSIVIATRTITNINSSVTYLGDSITSFSISPSLPTGVSLNTSTGRISGIPKVSIPQTVFTITGTNNGGSTTASFRLTVNSIAPSNLKYNDSNIVATRTITNINSSVIYSGDSITSFSITPSLPLGLSLNTSTGLISGIPLVTLPQTTFTITGTNNGGSTTASFRLTVNSIAPNNLKYNDSSIVATRTITNINSSVTYSGDSITNFSIIPVLPNGLSLNTTTGLISGTPTVNIAQTIFTITGSNSGGSTTTNFTLTVNSPVSIKPINVNTFSNINIKPNPFSSQIEIDFMSNTKENTKLVIIDAVGKEVFVKTIQSNIGNNNIIIDEMTNLNSGIYFARLESNSGYSPSFKLVKN